MLLSTLGVKYGSGKKVHNFSKKNGGEGEEGGSEHQILATAAYLITTESLALFSVPLSSSTCWCVLYARPFVSCSVPLPLGICGMFMLPLLPGAGGILTPRAPSHAPN